MRGDKAGLGGVAVGLGWCAQQDVPSADTPGERTVARTVAPVPGPDRLGHRPGTGPGCSHHRQMGSRLRRGRACSLDIRADRGFPPALGETQQAELTGAVQELPEMSGIEMANWNWKVVRQFVSKRFGIGLSRSTCLNYLHRLGFVLKRPKKRLVKADEQKREAFVAEYATLSDEAWRTGAKIFFADEAHFRADAELRGKWVLKGEPAPRFHEGSLWWTRPARAMAKRPATTRQCAWRPVRWSGWTWRGTATPEPRLPSWSGCGRGTPGR